MAADLVVDEVPMAPPPSDSPSIYVQLLGGLAAGLDSTFCGGIDCGDYPMDAGWAAAGTIGVVVMDGLSVEADVLAVSRDFTDYGPLSSVSLMGNLKYTAAVTDTVSIYGAAGIGYIRYVDDYEDYGFIYSGLGYQLIAGAAVNVTDNVAVVGELRYQDTFGNALYEDDDTYSLDAPTAAAMIGIKLGM